jgi:hypothetical protein
MHVDGIFENDVVQAFRTAGVADPKVRTTSNGKSLSTRDGREETMCNLNLSVET